MAGREAASFCVGSGPSWMRRTSSGEYVSEGSIHSLFGRSLCSFSAEERG